MWVHRRVWVTEEPEPIWGEQTGFSCGIVLEDGEYTGCGDASLGIKSAASQQWLEARTASQTFPFYCKRRLVLCISVPLV